MNEVSSHPFLLAIKEKKYFRNALSNKNFKCRSFDENLVSNPKFIMDKIMAQFDDFKRSFRNLVETARKNNLILLDFFSCKNQLIHFTNKIRPKFEFCNFFMNSFKEIKEIDIKENFIDDLQKLSNMKFLLNYLKIIDYTSFTFDTDPVFNKIEDFYLKRLNIISNNNFGSVNNYFVYYLFEN